ncbi:MAG: carboxypeptidase-like regulatory domain-containing protein [Chitinophagaceae bacterium]
MMDQTDKPLPRVSVTVKGTKKGTTTNTMGLFFLDADVEKDVLVFSYVGFEMREIKLTNAATELKVVLKNLNNTLSDVVVIGYGTATRRDITGSVASIGSKEIKSQPINSFNQALQGRVSGVQIIIRST